MLAAPNHSQVAGDLAREWNDNQTVKSLSRLTQAEQVERLLKDSPHEFSMQARREKLQLDERHDDELVLRAWSENGWWDNPEIDDLKMRGSSAAKPIPKTSWMCQSTSPSLRRMMRVVRVMLHHYASILRSWRVQLWPKGGCI